MKIKTSVISTVFNEERNIKSFLDSVINQSKKPDEFIIVDGGSKDNTYKILKEYSKRYKWIKVYLKRGNISQGRNYAVKKSKGDIIFTGDSGTIFEKDWVKKILNGFNSGADVVFGRWKIEPHNLVEKFLVSRTPNWDKIDPNKFIPSNRQVAFKRKVIENVGGFPEHIRRADDNWIHLKAHKLGFRYHFVKDAEVTWILERNFKGMLKLAFQDSKTEGFAGIFHERKIYFAEFGLLILGVGILLSGIISNIRIIIYSIIVGLILSLIIGGLGTYIKVRNIKMIFIGPLFFVMLYFAHISGVLTGIIQRSYKNKE